MLITPVKIIILCFSSVYHCLFFTCFRAHDKPINPLSIESLVVISVACLVTCSRKLKTSCCCSVLKGIYPSHLGSQLVADQSILFIVDVFSTKALT